MGVVEISDMDEATELEIEEVQDFDESLEDCIDDTAENNDVIEELTGSEDARGVEYHDNEPDFSRLEDSQV